MLYPEAVLGSRKRGLSKGTHEPSRKLSVMSLTCWDGFSEAASFWPPTGLLSGRTSACSTEDTPETGFLRTGVAKQSDGFICGGGSGGEKARKQGCKFQAEGLTLQAHLPSPSASLHYLPKNLTTDEKQPPNQTACHQHSLKT